MSAIGWFGAAASPLPKKFNAATLTGRTHRKTGSVGIERIGPLIAEHTAAAEADRRLSDAVYHAMYDAGLYGMLAPKAFGGLELHPADCFRLWAAVARIVLRRRGSVIVR